MSLTPAFTLALFLTTTALPALAGPELGPASPQSLPGKFALGAGYSYQASRWKTDIPELNMSNVRQNFWYASVGYGLAQCCEAYLRVGMADLSSSASNPERSPAKALESAFTLPGTLETGYEPYLSLGLKGTLFPRPEVALGASFQFTYYSDGKAQTSGTEWRWDGDDDYVVLVEFVNRYDISAGLNLDIIGDWGLFYVGGFYYKAAGKASGRLEWKVEPPEVHTFSGDIEEKESLGANAGFRIIVRRGWYATVEGQYRSQAAVSISLCKAFGA